jgi:putative heme-binding domain-containing protein
LACINALAGEDTLPKTSSRVIDERTSIAVEALNRLPDGDISDKPQIKTAVERVLGSLRGMPEFVKLVRKFNLTNQSAGLLEIAVAESASETGVEAVRLILANKDFDLLRGRLQRTNDSTAMKLAEALGNTGENQIASLLLPLVADAGRDASLRKQCVRSLAQTSVGAASLLKLAKEDKLDDALKFTASSELNRVRWPNLQEEAGKVLPLPAGQNAQPLPPLAELLKMQGDPVNGDKVFRRDPPACIKCHQVNGEGTEIGPALSGIGAKLGKDALYEAILDPNAGISFGFEAYQLQSKSGDEVFGLLVSETTDEVAIKDLKGIVTKHKKSDIVERRQLKTSIMPTSLQQGMTTQELVDLVEYLVSLKKPASQ